MLKYYFGPACRRVLTRAFLHVARHVVLWNTRRRDRRTLALLSDRSLRDLGIDRDAVDRDSAMSFWRVD